MGKKQIFGLRLYKIHHDYDDIGDYYPFDEHLLEWKLPILHELLKVKEDNFVSNNFVDIEIATMINFLCSD